MHSSVLLLIFFARLLQEDPVLFQLYKDLVVANVITAEEFWANRFTVSLYCCVNTYKFMHLITML